MAKNKELIEKGKQLGKVGAEYLIEQAAWNGYDWESEGGYFTEKGVCRFANTFMEILDTWDEIDDDILEECIDNVIEEE